MATVSFSWSVQQKLSIFKTNFLSPTFVQRIAQNKFEKSKGFADGTNTTYKEYMESGNMSLIAHLSSQPSLGISPIQTPIINEKAGKLQLCPFKLQGLLNLYDGTIKVSHLCNIYPYWLTCCQVLFEIKEMSCA
jgi:hypothetical protein